MSSYTVVKVLVLCLGAVSVVTRTLPEQRSEINARTAGGYGFSNTPTNQDSADARIDFSEFNAATNANDLKRRDGTATVLWDLRSTDCVPVCSKIEDPERNPDDCKNLSESLLRTVNDTAVGPFGVFVNQVGNCSILWNSVTSNDLITTNQNLANAMNALSSANCESQSLGKHCQVNKPPYGHGADIFLGHPDYIRRLITNNETLGELGHETK